MRAGAIVCVLGLMVTSVAGATRAFDLNDDISLRQFVRLGAGESPILYSPNGKYFVVQVEGARLETNRVQAELRVYRSRDVRKWLLSVAKPPQPLWSFSFTAADGPVVSGVKWFGGSQGLAFLARSQDGSHTLQIADIFRRRISRGSLAGQNVNGFDVRDSSHFVYTAVSSVVRGGRSRDGQAALVVSPDAEVNIADVLSTENDTADLENYTLSDLWTDTGKDVHLVVNPAGQPIRLQNPAGHLILALSPDSASLLTSYGVRRIPASWSTLYPPLDPLSSYVISSGTQDIEALKAPAPLVRRYVAIDLRTGAMTPLLDAPIGENAGWFHRESASWMPDGKSVVLSNVFVPTVKKDRAPVRPCVALVSFDTHKAACLEELRGITSSGYEPGYHFVAGVRALSSDEIQVLTASANEKPGMEFYRKALDGEWGISEVDTHNREVTVAIHENPSEPPQLVAHLDNAKSESRVLWDPNLSLRSIRFVRVEPVQGEDSTGRRWSGGLFLPATPRPKGGRYPLVIQTHGFLADQFIPSGRFTNAEGAEELATDGIAVLQMENCNVQGIDEGPCQVRGYQGAVRELANSGLIDRDKVGIEGFSRTCYYVMQALTASSIDFRAAVISSGINGGYFQSLLFKFIERDSESTIGAAPLGPSLKLWFAESPEFNILNVHAPLRIEAPEGPTSVLMMWEPYALLRYAKKPVEFVLFERPGTHPLTNPKQREISQGGSIDWMRFWLQGHEDSDRGKAEEYRRWEKLCDQQKANNPDRPTFCVPSGKAAPN